MAKIRIPRKKNKRSYVTRMRTYHSYQYVPKLEKYLSYFVIEYGIKQYGLSAEELYWKYGRYVMDDVIWWHWVRYKKLGIVPRMNDPFKKYWDQYVSQGVIKLTHA